MRGPFLSVVFFVFFPFQAFTDIAFFPVSMSDRNVDIKQCLHLFNYVKRYPMIPVAIRSSMMNKSFYIFGRRYAIVSPFDRFFLPMNFHV